MRLPGTVFRSCLAKSKYFETLFFFFLMNQTKEQIVSFSQDPMCDPCGVATLVWEPLVWSKYKLHRRTDNKTISLVGVFGLNKTTYLLMICGLWRKHCMIPTCFKSVCGCFSLSGYWYRFSLPSNVTTRHLCSSTISIIHQQFLCFLCYNDFS